MVDLRGNLGGYRTRRHAVLGAFVSPSTWPEEREGAWSMAGRFDVVPAMPIVRVRNVIDVSVAVMVDGLSFSASLLLADALEHGVRRVCSVVRRWVCAEGARAIRRPCFSLVPASSLDSRRQTELGSAPLPHSLFRMMQGAMPPALVEQSGSVASVFDLEQAR